jgi:hypothetical protein
MNNDDEKWASVLYKRRAYFTSWINCYPFLEGLRRVRANYQGFFPRDGCYILYWNDKHER